MFKTIHLLLSILISRSNISIMLDSKSGICLGLEEEGWKRHPTGKFLRPTSLAQLWGADFEIFVIWLSKGAFSLDFNLKPRFRQMVIDFISELIAGP